MKIYVIIILCFINSCCQLLADGDKSKGSDVEYHAEIIKEILKKGISAKEDEQKITEAFKKLIEMDTDEAMRAIVRSCLGCTELKDEEKLLYLFGQALKDASIKRSLLYDKLQKYLDDEDGDVGFTIGFLAKIDKPRVFDYLIQEFHNDDKKYEVVRDIDGYRPTLWDLWRLAELRDKRIVEVLKKFKPKGIREDLAIAEAYCLVNHEYEKNLNFILNSFERSIVDDFLSHIEEIGNPEAIDFLEKNRYELLVDCYELDLDNIIAELKKNEGLIQRHHIKVTCSSTLIEENNKFLYDIDNIFDNDDNTAWVEGAEGDGIGEWIQFDFDREYKINRIDLISGYSKSRSIFKANNRIKNLELLFSDGVKINLDLKDTMDLQKIKIEPHVTKSIKFTIKDVYKGSKYEDTCISELKLWGSKVVD